MSTFVKRINNLSMTKINDRIDELITKFCNYLMQCCRLNLKFLIGLFLLIAYSYSCTESNIQAPEIQCNSISADNMYLKIGDSTVLNIGLSNSDLDDVKFDWTSKFGSIKGSGNIVTYYAPDSVVSDIIKVTIKGIDSAERVSNVKINVFNQLVILKADDMVFDENTIVPQRWILFIDYITRKGIKASIGVIGNSLEAGNKEYFKYLRSIAALGNFELWNHGYNHIYDGKYPNGESYKEFSNTPYAYQYEHMLYTDSLAIKKLGVVFHTFGAPGNGIDSTTVRAINNQKNIKVWLFGLPESKKLNLQRFNDIEFPTSNPVYSKFVENYSSEKPYLVLQIHPNAWDRDKFAEFEKIIDFLLSKKVTFINPYDYYLLMNSKEWTFPQQGT